MVLAPGTVLGPYEILAPLGAGGMGEVFRARDSRLGRDVAIKAMSPAFAGDAERVSRFQREAHILAALNHPNIAAIYGLEELGDARFLVLEFVPGETLGERIARGPLPPEEAFEICSQIADGLEAGHERGIVHRDLKPANIKITPGGKVKVLDFGLAKDTLMATAASADSPTLTVTSPAYTRAGVILGTAAYMSPEQARGKTVDKRTDIWAFGCILYECLTGKMAFGGETVSDTLAAVIKSEPDWRALPPAVTPATRELLRRCLEKNPAARLRDIADVRILLADSLVADPTPQKTAPQRQRRVGPFAAAACLAALVLGAAGALWWSGRAEPAGSWSGVLLGGPELSTMPRASPDGHLLAFIAADRDQVMQVWVMNPESGNRVMLTHHRDRGYAMSCGWTPDGSRILFGRWNDQPNGIFSVPALGGEEQTILESGGYPETLPDGSLLLTQINPQHQWQLQRYWPESGKTRFYDVITGPAFPSIRTFANGKRVLATGTRSGSSDAAPRINIVDLDSGRVQEHQVDFGDSLYGAPAGVMAGGRSAVYASVHGSQSRILSIPIDGPGQPQLLFTVSAGILTLDTGSDGSIYFDYPERPMEILRFSPEGGRTEHIASVPRSASDFFTALPDGRAVWAEYEFGRSRLMLAAPGKEPSSFLNTNEDVSGPFTAVGQDQVAFLIGSQPRHAIAVAAVSTGRIIHRFDFNQGFIEELAASPDGKLLYVAASGSIWETAVTGGQARRVRTGDSVAVDADGTLLIQSSEPPVTKLIRVRPSGGPEQEIKLSGDIHPGFGLDGGGIFHGRLVAPLSAPYWYWPPGIFELESGAGKRIPLDLTTDFHHMVWTADGSVMANVFGWRSTMWKYKKESR